MPTFEYEAYSDRGERERGVLEAKSRGDAIIALRNRGLRIVRAEEATYSTSHPLGILRTFRDRLNLRELAELAKELAVLSEAGLAIDDALRATLAQALNAQSSRLVSRLLQSVIEGMSLSTAFERHAVGAPAYLVPLLRAGEARGTLAPTLSELARYMDEQADLRAKIQSALAYPLILAFAAIATVAIIITVLVPSLLPLFEGTNASPPMALVLADRVGWILSRHWPSICIVMLASVVGLAIVWQRQPLRLAFARIVLDVPVIGPYVVASNVAQFGRTLGTLVRNGVGLMSALAITSSVLSNTHFIESVNHASERVREGQKLSQSLAMHQCYPPIAIRLIAMGEESSRLDEMLLHMSNVFAKQNQRRTERLLAFLTPALTITIGLFVGALILSVMQAILSVNQLAVG